MHVFSRFKPRCYLCTPLNYYYISLHITADREFKELLVDLEWILYPKKLKHDLLVINTASKKQNNTCSKEIPSSLQVAVKDFSAFFIESLLSCWIWWSIFRSIISLFESFILKTPCLSTSVRTAQLTGENLKFSKVFWGNTWE